MTSSHMIQLPRRDDRVLDVINDAADVGLLKALRLAFLAFF